MIRKKFTASLGSAMLCGTMIFAVASPAEAANKTYKNCTALNKDYKHGVGKPGAKDKTSGRPVTNFKKSKAIYDKNKKSDRDKDGIACEKR
ncbi:MAG: excalibur calcium-binding domain-containing protein [Aeromicrobium sp.]